MFTLDNLSLMAHVGNLNIDSRVTLYGFTQSQRWIITYKIDLMPIVVDGNYSLPN